MRRVGITVLLGIAGAFAVTLASWLFASTASAEENPVTPLVNIVGDAVDAVGDTAHAVSAKVLPPAQPAVTDSVTKLDESLHETMRTLVRVPDKEPVRTASGTGKTRVPVASSPVPVPGKPPAVAPVHRHPSSPKPASVDYGAPRVTEPPGDRRPVPQPEAPAPVRDSGQQWGVPVAPASTGGTGAFHSPDVPAFAAGAPAARIGLPVSGSPRPQGPIVFRTVSAQPGVTPD